MFFLSRRLTVSLLPQLFQYTLHCFHVPNCRLATCPVDYDRPLQSIGILSCSHDNLVCGIWSSLECRVSREESISGWLWLCCRREVRENGPNLIRCGRWVLNYFEIECQRASWRVRWRIMRRKSSIQKTKCGLRWRRGGIMTWRKDNKNPGLVVIESTELEWTLTR